MWQLLRLNWGGAAAIALALLASYPAGVAASGSDAVPVAPHNDAAAIFDVLSSEHDFELDRATLTFIHHALEQEHYRVRWYGRGGNAGPATLRNFVNLAHVGVLVIDTHGSSSSLLVQRYRTDAAATKGRDDYVRQYGAKSRDWMFVDSRDLLLTREGIDHFFGDRPGKHIDLVFNIACEGWHLFADFDPVAYFGYSTDVVCETAALDAETLFSRLSGDSGVENRTTVGAYGLGGFVHEGSRQQLRLSDPGHPVVLSPAVDSLTFDEPPSPGATSQGHVQFDARMLEKPSVVGVSGCGATVSGQHWTDHSTVLAFNLTMPSTASGGTLTVTVHKNEAVAWPGGSANDDLDGNQSPSPSNGVAPNVSDYVYETPCAGASGSADFSGNVSGTTQLVADGCWDSSTFGGAYGYGEAVGFSPTGTGPPTWIVSLNLQQPGTTTFPDPSAGNTQMAYYPNGAYTASGQGNQALDTWYYDPGYATLDSPSGTATISADGSQGSFNLTLQPLEQKGSQATSNETAIGSWHYTDC